MAVDFNYFLRAKYAQLQQQADATTRNAATNALTGAAAARLDSTRASLLPAESRASIAKTRADTNLVNEQAAIVAPESRARIAGINADIGLTRANTNLAVRQGTPLGILGGERVQSSLINTLYGGTPNSGAGFRTSDIVPGRDSRRIARGLGRNPSVEDLDYANGL